MDNNSSSSTGCPDPAIIKSEPLENEGKEDKHESNDVTDRINRLIQENKRLYGIFAGLERRQTLLEDFIEVQHGTEFDSFVTKRSRLVEVMEGGAEEPEQTSVTGKRSEKSKELVNLLKAANTQADVPGQSGQANAYQPQPPPAVSQPQPRPYNPHHKFNKKNKNRGGNGSRNAQAFQNWNNFSDQSHQANHYQQYSGFH